MRHFLLRSVQYIRALIAVIKMKGYMGRIIYRNVRESKENTLFLKSGRIFQAFWEYRQRLAALHISVFIFTVIKVIEMADVKGRTTINRVKEKLRELLNRKAVISSSLR